MARKALGNDPFARGAVGRIPSAATPRSSTPRTSPSLPRTPIREKPPVRSPSSTEVIARELLETAGARFRRFMESSLPALIEGVTRSSIDTLGLTALPVEVSDVDDFGMSLEFVERWQPVLARVLFNYFRAELLGFDKLPATGPAVLVCNHGGILPYDEVLLKVAVRERPGPGGPPGRDLRPLSEDFAINSPFAGSFLNRFGLVRASPDNAERLLRAGHLVAVFPEGAHGIAKLYRNRYRLQRFGRGGFVRLALRTGAPIYPVVLLGGEEAQPVVAKMPLPKPLRPRQLPITPTFPLLGPIGLLPLPVRWTVQIGDPIVLAGGAAAAEDQSRVTGYSEDVRAKMQSMLGAQLEKRRS
jgi:1-acyl-sn-glycerol-3-phosphate acyltransferase